MTTENRVTKEAIERKIAKVAYQRVEGTTLTMCYLTMANGCTVTGESACVDPANFDREIGETIAYDNAFNKLWLLEGYLLLERLHQAAIPTLDETQAI